MGGLVGVDGEIEVSRTSRPSVSAAAVHFQHWCLAGSELQLHLCTFAPKWQPCEDLLLPILAGWRLPSTVL